MDSGGEVAYVSGEGKVKGETCHNDKPGLGGQDIGRLVRCCKGVNELVEGGWERRCGPVETFKEAVSVSKDLEE